MTKVIVRVHPVHLRMQTEHRVAANPQTKPVDLGCESAENGSYHLQFHIHHRHCYYYSAYKLILILPSHGGWKA